MKRFNIITTLTNGAGLEKDYFLIRRLLESYGHEVNGVEYQPQYVRVKSADINIFMEFVAPYAIDAAPEQWLIPNSEWWRGSWDRFLPHFSKILCKTQDCFDIWSKKVQISKLVYTGFESFDFYRPEISRLPMFLHMAGNSTTRNTIAVAEAWRKYVIPYQLIIVANKDEIAKHCNKINNVSLVKRYDEFDVIDKMNKCAYHIIPSMYEGFGHSIHEALGCGGVVITTNAPPMNSISGIKKELLIPVSSRTPRGDAYYNFVEPNAVALAVQSAASLNREQLDKTSAIARSAFLLDRDYFRKAFRALMPSD